MSDRHERVLYQFPISHYCEKTRWNLDAKGLAYKLTNLPPGVHVRVIRKMAASNTVPVLVDRGRVLADSTEIALHLDEAYPSSRPMVPTHPGDRARVLEIEGWLDVDVGPAVRRYLYGELMRERGGAARAFWRSYPRPLRWLEIPLGRTFEKILRKQLRINDDTVRRDRATLMTAFDRLDALLEGDTNRMLVGDEFTIADITAAALLGPLLTPERSPWAWMKNDMPHDAAALRAELAARPAGRWIAERYRLDR